MTETPQHWLKCIREGRKPAYILIAEQIAEDIHRGILGVRDQLPTLRDLARDLGLNYTTVARGYAEARKRGLIDTHVGIGTVVIGRHPAIPIQSGTSAAMTMNAPPEPDHPGLLDTLRTEAAALFTQDSKDGIYDLLRYQDFGGTARDKEAGAQWLRSHLPDCDASQILVAPGIHSALLAIMSMLAQRGDTICVESLCYPGIKALTAQLGITIQALPMDEEGILPNAFEHVCKTVRPKVLICTPTIQNPTTATMGKVRRKQIADIALRYSIPIVEDDAYAKLTDHSLPTLSSLAPGLTYYIGGLSKCLGAGLRIAYIYSPTDIHNRKLAGALRATTVMASPVTAALATRWILSGAADQLLNAVRIESAERQALAMRILHNADIQSDPAGFHVWVRLAAEQNAVELAHTLREHGVPCVASVAFSTDAAPPSAIRLSLGGNLTRRDIQNGLHFTSTMLMPV